MQESVSDAGPAPATPEEVGSAPEHAPAVGSAWVRTRSSALSWLRTNAADMVIVTTLGALTILVVALDIEGIATGGDAIRKWHFVRAWFHHTSFRHTPWNHHMSRFGIHWVTWLVQLIAGRGPNMYYVPGLIAVCVQTMFVYACGKRLGGRLAGVLACFLLIYFKGAIRAGSQLMPEVFSGAYAMIATYLYLRYADAEGRHRRAWLVALSTTLFVSYLAKETNIFFFPGFALAMWLVGGRYRDRFRDLAILGGILLAGLLLETAGYRLFTDYSSRFAIIVETHTPEDPKGPQSFMELFNRFPKLEEFWKVAFYSFLPIGVSVVAFLKNRRVTAVYVIAASYFLALTFLVRQLDPFSVWLSFRNRYFDPMAPFVMLFAGLFVIMIGKELLGRLGERPWAKRLMSPPPYIAAAAVILLSLGASAKSYTSAAPKFEKHPFRFNRKMAKIATDAYRRNLPIMAVRDNRAPMVVYSVLIDDRLLSQPDGQLLEFREIRREARGKWWFTKNARLYSTASLNRAISEGCVVDVTVVAPKAISKMEPMERLPERCDEFVPREPPPGGTRPDPESSGAEPKDVEPEESPPKEPEPQ